MTYSLSDSKRKRAIYIGSFGILLLLCLKSCQHDGQQHKNHFYPTKKELSVLGYIGLNDPFSLLWKTPTEARSRLPESPIGEKNSPEFSFFALVERSITPFASLFESLQKKFWWPNSEGVKGTSSNFRAPLSIAGKEGPRSRIVNNVRGHNNPVRGDTGRRALLHPTFGHAPVLNPTFGNVPPAHIAPPHVAPVAMQATPGRVAVVNPQRGVFQPDSSQQLLGSPRVELPAPSIMGSMGGKDLWGGRKHDDEPGSSAPAVLASNQVNVTRNPQQADQNSMSTTSSKADLSDPEMADLLKKNYIPIVFKGGMGGKDLPGSDKRDDEGGSSSSAVLANNQVIIVQKAQQANKKTTPPSTPLKGGLSNADTPDLLKTKSPILDVMNGEHAKVGQTTSTVGNGTETDPNNKPLLTNKGIGVSVENTLKTGDALLLGNSALSENGEKKQVPTLTPLNGDESHGKTSELLPNGNITMPSVLLPPMAKDLANGNTLSPSLQATNDTDPVTQKGTLHPNDASSSLIKTEGHLDIPLKNVVTIKSGETTSASSHGSQSNPTNTPLFTNKGMEISIANKEDEHGAIIEHSAKEAKNKQVSSSTPSNGSESDAKTSKTFPLESIPVVVGSAQPSPTDTLTFSPLELTKENTISTSFQATSETDPIKQNGVPVADNSDPSLLDNKNNVNLSIFQKVSPADAESGKNTPIPSSQGSMSVTENSTPLPHNVVTPEGLLTSLQTQETPISANTTQISPSPSSKGSENNPEDSQQVNHSKTLIEDLLTTETKVATEATTNEVTSSIPSVAQVSPDENKDQISTTNLKKLFDDLMNAIEKAHRSINEEEVAAIINMQSSEASKGKRTSVSLPPLVQDGYQTLGHALANLLKTSLSTENEVSNSNDSALISKTAMNAEPKQTLLNAGKAVNEAVQQLVEASKNIPHAQKIVEECEKAAKNTVKLLTSPRGFQTLSPKEINTVQALIPFWENFHKGFIGNEEALNDASPVSNRITSPAKNQDANKDEKEQKNSDMILLSSLVNKGGTKVQPSPNKANDVQEKNTKPFPNIDDNRIIEKLQARVLKKSATFAADSKPSPKDIELAKDLLGDLLINLATPAQQIPAEESLKEAVTKSNWKQNKRWTITSSCRDEIKKEIQKQNRPVSGRSYEDNLLPKGMPVS